MRLQWRNLLALVTLAAIIGCSPKQHDLVVAEVGTNRVKLNEYENFFARNSGGWDVAQSSSLEERERFLNLLTNYRLKLQDAYDRGLQHDPELKAELADYRSSLAATFLIDKEITQPGIRQLYERRKEELRASHILLPVRQGASPEDTAKAYATALEVIQKALAGEPFDSLAKQYSGDPSAKTNFGDIYYFTGGQMTPLFENAAYAMKKGEISKTPVRTPFGYHIIKLVDRQPARGMLKVRHIMARFATPADSDTVAPHKRITELLDSLRKGADFATLAKSASEDAGSAPNGGDLGWFERRRWVQPFDEAAFLLSPGQLSPIVRTPYGFHLIKCDSAMPLQSFEELRDELKQTYTQFRYNDDFAAYVTEWKKRYNFSFNEALFDSFVSRLDTNGTIEDSGWTAAVPPADLRQALYTVNGKQIALDSAIGVLQRRPEYKNTALEKRELRSRFDRIGDGIIFNERAIDLEGRYPEFASMMREYEEGIVLFKAEQTEVWNNVTVTDSALREYWSANREKFKTLPKVKYDEIFVGSDTVALVLYDSLTRGADFRALAEQFNEDPELKASAGARDPVQVSASPLSRLADSLAVGEVSEPQYSENGGWSIIKVVAKEAPRTKTFEEAGAEVSNALQEAESKRLESAWLERLRVKYPVKQYKDRLGLAFTSGQKPVQ